jgi:hypothetical protein
MALAFVQALTGAASPVPGLHSLGIALTASYVPRRQTSQRVFSFQSIVLFDHSSIPFMNRSEGLRSARPGLPGGAVHRGGA